MSNFALFPPLEPYATGMLPVDTLHTLYWEECGNPRGVPVVFLHGGPGSGCTPDQRRFFDPTVWRIVLFDQRGAGRSTPLYELRDNTTHHLIADIETLRRARDIERWHIFGGSWGSTLALAYAEAHPQNCLSLMLRGIFLMRDSEIDWFLYGTRHLFPENWQSFADFAGYRKGDDLLDLYWNLMTKGPNDKRHEAMSVWATYESNCSSHDKKPAPPYTGSALPLMEAHYMRNVRFPEGKGLLDSIHKIRHIPCFIAQGRYDCVCPIETAYDLHQAWPESELRIIPDAGHSLMEPGLAAALIEATTRFKTLV